MHNNNDPRLYMEVGTDDVSGKWIQLYTNGGVWVENAGLDPSYGYLVIMLNSYDENFTGALAL